MNAATQFRALARLTSQIIAEEEDGKVPVDRLRHLLACTENQAEMAEAGLLEPEKD